MVSVTVTSRCNLRCVMCHHSQSHIKKEDVRDEVIAKLAGHMAAASAIDLTGLGEGLLSPKFKKILKMFPIKRGSSPKDFKISFNCNGTTLDEENINLLLSSKIQKIRISIDAADPALFRAIRGVDLKPIVAGTARLIAARKALGRSYPLIGIQMTLMKSNLSDLRGIADLCAELEADFLEVWSLNEIERDIAEAWNVSLFNYEDQKLSNASPQRVRSAVDDIHAYAAPRRINLLTMVLGDARWSDGYPGEDWGSESSIPWRPESIRCALPWQVQKVHYDGEVHACCWATKPIAHLRDCSAEEAWNGPAIRNMRENLLSGRIPSQCSGAGCPFILGKTPADERVETVRRLNEVELNLFNELATQEIMRKHAAPGSAAIDVGANSGVHVELLHQLVGPEGIVHAFEPNPIFLHCLSSISNNVRVWSMALGSQFGLREFFVPEGDDEQASFEYERVMSSGREVATYSVVEARLDDIPEVSLDRVSIVKIDVEGHELHALLGMRDLIERDEPVVVYEANTEEINRFWAELGYVIYYPTVDQRIALPNVVALPASLALQHEAALIEDSDVDRLLEEVRRRLARGGDRLSDRLRAEVV